MKNVKTISPVKGGTNIRIISVGSAIDNQILIAKMRNHTYTSIQSVLDDILCCPTVSLTNDPVGSIYIS